MDAGTANGHTPGGWLKLKRIELHLTMRQVYEQSILMAANLGNEEFVITPSRLHDIEIRDAVPNIYKLKALATTYGMKLTEILKLYGIENDACVK